MANVDDHGLEVLKKAAVNLDPTSKRNYALQVAPANTFAPPFDADFIRSNLDGLIQTITYRRGGPSGTILKTLTITYDDCDYQSYTVAVS